MKKAPQDVTSFKHTNVYLQIMKYSTQMQFTVISKDNLTRFIGI